MSAHRTILSLAAMLFALPAAAQERTPRGPVDLDAELLTPLVLFNDGDFDRTPPAYNADKQHVGLVGTLFRPGVTFAITQQLRIRYQAEVGLNLWSRNNADRLDATADDIFLLLHRQVYAEGDTADDRFGFKVGYDRWSDPTQLMFAHWTGAAGVRFGLHDAELQLTAGLLPDATFEGWQVTENNFTHDIFFGQVSLGVMESSRRFGAVIGSNVLADCSEVGRPLVLIAPHLHLMLAIPSFHAEPNLEVTLDLVGQFGTHVGTALDGGDESQAAWAAQVHADARIRALGVSINLLALSPDDELEGNGFNGGFHYSGLSRSRTLWLSENELVDLWNNLDERTGTRQGGHFLHRMGLLQGDVRVAWTAGPVFEPALIVGAAGALRPANALDAGFIGLETDLDLTFRHRDVLEFHVIGSLIVPGGAAAAAVNRIDRTATDLQFGGMTMLTVTF